MKTFVIASGLALASLAAPQVAFAQDQQTGAEIIVSAEHQRAWDRGNSREAEGLRDLQGAQRDLVRYSAAVVEAQDKRDTSRDRADNARQSFESLTARPFFTDPGDARDWAKQVEETAKDWERFEERSEEGARELSRVQRRQANAQEAVDKAQAKIDEGRAMMADAERASQRQARR
ncbi:hypothetical protein [Erythrobacter sp. MTPC3]|uniref:hypothetical protein n=1 Tax=Erythrobacter sp. MTPC3 TaxID=3056564 RepID=UPI0036F26763